MLSTVFPTEFTQPITIQSLSLSLIRISSLQESEQFLVSTDTRDIDWARHHHSAVGLGSVAFFVVEAAAVAVADGLGAFLGLADLLRLPRLRPPPGVLVWSPACFLDPLVEGLAAAGCFLGAAF